MILQQVKYIIFAVIIFFVCALITNIFMDGKSKNKRWEGAAVICAVMDFSLMLLIDDVETRIVVACVILSALCYGLVFKDK